MNCAVCGQRLDPRGLPAHLQAHDPEIRAALFWTKVDKRGPAECWEWTAGRDRHGYGRFNRVFRGGPVPAHRHAYESTRGPIAEGLELDHLCRNRGCVNPAHLEPVTKRENILRGESLPAQNARRTHCHAGHPLSGPTVLVSGRGHRRCRPCNAAYERRRRLTLAEVGQ